MSTDPPIVAPDIEADRPEWGWTRFGSAEMELHGKACAVELLNDAGELRGFAVVQDLPDTKKDGWTIDIWSAKGAEDLERIVDRVSGLLGLDADKDMPVRTVRTDATEGPATQEAATRMIAAVGARADRVERGWCHDDMEDARALLRAAAVILKGKAADDLRAADDAIVNGKHAEVSRILERHGGDRTEQALTGRVLEALHQTRSQDEFESKLAETGIGLVGVSDGNKTAWVVEDRRRSDAQGRHPQFALESVGLTDEIEPAKVREAWAGGRPVDAEPALIRHDIWSTKRPAPERRPDAIEDIAQRADDQRHGQARAATAYTSFLSKEQQAAIADARREIVREHAAEGKPGDATLTEVSRRLEQRGITFGIKVGRDGEVHQQSLVDRLGEIHSRKPLPDAVERMKEYTAATVFSVQSELLAENRPPTFAALSQRLADRGVAVSRELDAKTGKHTYEFHAAVDGVGGFSFTAEKLGFDAKADPKLDMDRIVRVAEQADLQMRASKAVEQAAHRSDSFFNVFSNRRAKFIDHLAKQGFTPTVLGQEQVGKDADGVPVYGLRMGLRDDSTGAAIAMSECGVRGVDFVRADGLAFTGKHKVDDNTSEVRKQRWSDFGNDLASAFGKALENDRSANAWASMNKRYATKSWTTAPEVAGPSWERQQSSPKLERSMS